MKHFFPSDSNPFYAGYGDGNTVKCIYKKMGITKGETFIINPKGEVPTNNSVYVNC